MQCQVNPRPRVVCGFGCVADASAAHDALVGTARHGVRHYGELRCARRAVARSLGEPTRTLSWRDCCPWLSLGALLRSRRGRGRSRGLGREVECLERCGIHQTTKRTRFADSGWAWGRRLCTSHLGFVFPFDGPGAQAPKLFSPRPAPSRQIPPVSSITRRAQLISIITYHGTQGTRAPGPPTMLNSRAQAHNHAAARCPCESLRAEHRPRSGHTRQPDGHHRTRACTTMSERGPPRPGGGALQPHPSVMLKLRRTSGSVAAMDAS